jgi:hypothetical protein
MIRITFSFDYLLIHTKLENIDIIRWLKIFEMNIQIERHRKNGYDTAVLSAQMCAQIMSQPKRYDILVCLTDITPVSCVDQELWKNVENVVDSL